MTVHDREALDTLLCEIEKILVESIPETVRRLNVSDPAYALVIAYLDLTTDEFTPYFYIAPERLREEWLAREGPTDGSWMIWSPLHLQERLKQATCEGTSLSEKCNACYEILCNNGTSGDEFDVVLLPFRQMMYRVALALNHRSWHDRLNPTDEFVVVVSDWTGYRSDDDVLASIPPDKRELLKSRNLLFYEDPADPWIIASKRYDQFKSGIRHSFDVELRFWMEQLERLADRDARYVKHGSTLAMVALTCLQEMGTDAALPILELAEKHADRGRRESDDPYSKTLIGELLYNVLRTATELGRADAHVEALLRSIFEKSYRANLGQTQWSTIPYFAAQALHGLFPKYPEPTKAENFAVENAPQFLTPPKAMS